MSGFKVAAVAIGVLIAFLFAGTIIGVVVHAVITLAIVGLVVGAAVVAIKMARSNRHVTRGPREREVQDTYSRRLPRADIGDFTAPAPPRPAGASDVDDELARLKREMGTGN